MQPREQTDWNQIPEDQQPKGRPPRGNLFSLFEGQFDRERFTHFMGMMLKLGFIGLIIWTLYEIAVTYQFDFMKFIGGQSFVYILTFGILGWVGQLMLTGKFHPPKQDPNKKKIKWSFDPTGGKGQQQTSYKPPQFGQQYRQPRQQPQYQPKQTQARQPVRRTPARNVPVQIQMDICNFCGRDFPVTDLKSIKQSDGTYLYVCKECLR